MQSMILKWVFILGGWAFAAGAGWLAWHEHAVASSQAARDQSRYAVVQAESTARVLHEQQKINAIQKATLIKELKISHTAARVSHGIAVAARNDAISVNRKIERLRYLSKKTSCARQPIPAAICSLTVGCKP